MASYRWLSDNYRDGDSVFLFGESFHLIVMKLHISYLRLPGLSRGAYQVRALAGMIA